MCLAQPRGLHVWYNSVCVQSLFKGGGPLLRSLLRGVRSHAQHVLFPVAGTPHAFLVQVRFADGSRATRRFLRDAPLAAVRSLCIARQPEAARGRAFVLSTMGLPGACGRP